MFVPNLNNKSLFLDIYILCVQGIVLPNQEPGVGCAVIPEDMLEEAVPGSIRRAEHFISFLKKIVIKI